MSTATSTATTFQVPLCQPEAPVLAIGDVHGCAAQLADALSISSDLLRTGEVAQAVLLGDLIDRGPESLRCLRLAAEFRDRHPGQVTLLAGNHEQFMLCSLYPPDEAVRQHATFNWLRNGGRELIFNDQIQQELSRWQLDCSGWASHYTSGNTIFVHAGVPGGATGKELARFLAEPLLGLPRESGESHAHWAWLRRGFLEYDIPVAGRFVVHGHSARDFTGKPLEGRMNLDSGCHKTGRLTLGVFSRGAVDLYTFETEKTC